MVSETRQFIFFMMLMVTMMASVYAMIDSAKAARCEAAADHARLMPWRGKE